MPLYSAAFFVLLLIIWGVQAPEGLFSSLYIAKYIFNILLKRIKQFISLIFIKYTPVCVCIEVSVHLSCIHSSYPTYLLHIFYDGSSFAEMPRCIFSSVSCCVHRGPPLLPRGEGPLTTAAADGGPLYSCFFRWPQVLGALCATEARVWRWRSEDSGCAYEVCEVYSKGKC